MTEDDARAWLDAQFDVSRETWARLESYIAFLTQEMVHQNLIAESTVPHIWARHIVDSAQLIEFAAERGGDGQNIPGPRPVEGHWVDLGSGAGLPALVIAALAPGMKVTMIESRRKRVDFLNGAIAAMKLDNASVIGGRVETAQVEPPADYISARAYAPLDKLFASAIHLARNSTIWVLPKGKNWQNELALARPSWQCVFHVEHSVTDPDSAIIIASDVTAKEKSGRGRTGQVKTGQAKAGRDKSGKRRK